MKVRNPFYPLLMVVGAVFSVTAFAYGVMAINAVRAVDVVATQVSNHPLLDWLERHGDATMLTELVTLGVLTIAAIGTDDYWERRAQRRSAAEP